jgi:hypothetical protein
VALEAKANCIVWPGKHVAVTVRGGCGGGIALPSVYHHLRRIAHVLAGRQGALYHVALGAAPVPPRTKPARRFSTSVTFNIGCAPVFRYSSKQL